MKKLLLFFLFFFAFFLVKTPFSFAQETATPTSASNARALPMNTNPDVPQNFHTYTQNVFIELLATAVCFTSGVDILTEDGRCLGVDPVTKKIGYSDQSTQGGLLSMMGGLIGATYNLPASTGTYTSYLASNFGIARSTLAQGTDCSSVKDDPLKYAVCTNDCSPLASNPSQYDACQQTVELNNANLPGATGGSGLGKGIGFDGLTPVLQIWKAFRNLTYLFFVILFVILGLGIMFRLNIDARTVMTIQNQIPKIIIALVLITFSYAIAGFLIDMMYLSIYLIIHLFASQQLATVTDISNPLNAVGGFGGISRIANPLAESVVGVIASIFDGGLGKIVAKTVTTIFGAFLGAKAGGGVATMIGAVAGGAIGTFFAPGAGTAAGAGLGMTLAKAGGGLIGAAIGYSKGPQILQYVAGIIIYIVIIIAILRALLMTWIALIKAYVFILLDVIFAPIFIMGGLLPASSTGGFTAWIRSLLGNLAAFPTVLILFLVGASIQSQIAGTNAIGNFIPPLVGDFSDGTGEMVAGIIGLGIILIMPESVNLSKQFFKSPERKLAQAALAPVGVAVGSAAQPFKSAWGSVWGEDKHTGAPKWLTKKVRERGTLFGALLTGGTHTEIPDRWGNGPHRKGPGFIAMPQRLKGSKLFARNRNAAQQAPDNGTRTQEQAAADAAQANVEGAPDAGGDPEAGGGSRI